MKRRTMIVEASGATMLLTMALQSLHQDQLGLERYVVYAREHWVSATFSVPAALVMLAIGRAWYVVLLWKGMSADSEDRVRDETIRRLKDPHNLWGDSSNPHSSNKEIDVELVSEERKS